METIFGRAWIAAMAMMTLWANFVTGLKQFAFNAMNKADRTLADLIHTATIIGYFLYGIGFVIAGLWLLRVVLRWLIL